jgi:hypothetical protein
MVINKVVDYIGFNSKFDELTIVFDDNSTFTVSGFFKIHCTKVAIGGNEELLIFETCTVFNIDASPDGQVLDIETSEGTITLMSKNYAMDGDFGGIQFEYI